MLGTGLHTTGARVPASGSWEALADPHTSGKRTRQLGRIYQNMDLYFLWQIREEDSFG